MPRNWMDRLRQKLSSKPNRRKETRHRERTEALEQRTYLSVTSLFAGGELQIVSDGADSIVVGTDIQNPGIVQVTVNGAGDPTLGTIQASTVSSLVIVGSDTDNLIDISGVTAADFSFFDAGTGLGIQIEVDGDDGDDTIIGSADLGSTLLGGNGADTITGGAAGLFIGSGDGNDSITTGDGNDTISGGNGSDIIDTGNGDDSIDAGDGNDSVTAGDGTDSINAGDGADTVDGGLGNDDINGMSGLDSLLGSDGDDTILGGSETDMISGGNGNDIVNGQAGDDIVHGDAGNDTALGGGGNDSLFGDDGDDILNGQSGNDTLDGGLGNDRGYGGGGMDSINGNSGDDTLLGHSGDDTLLGGGGVDSLIGGNGNDLVQSVVSEVQVGDLTTSGEGDAGTTLNGSFVVALSTPLAAAVNVTFSTSDGTATAGQDYVATSGTLTFPAGTTTLSIPVTILGDNLAESTETFFLNLTAADNGVQIFNSQGTATITDDDLSGTFGTPIQNFAGAGPAPLAPPDTVGDVGPNHFIQMRNDAGGSLVSIFNKDSTPAFAPFNLSSLAPAGSTVAGAGDPIVVYDEAAGRWVMMEFSGRDAVEADEIYVYISQNSSPTNNPADWSFFEFVFPVAGTGFPDYPKLAVWPDGYYITTNEAGTSDPPVYVLDRVNMLAGLTPRPFQRVTASPLAGFGFQALTPVDLDGSTAPPTGNGGYSIRHRDDEAHNVGSNDPNQDFIELFEYNVDLDNAANSSFQLLASIPISEFDSDLNGLFAFNAIAQPGTTQQLDPLREVVMWKPTYRNFGTHESIVGSFVTDVDGTDHAGVRWFELRRTGTGPWQLYQEGTVAPDADSRWMSAINIDAAGNIALAYSVSGTSTFPGLRYTGRLATDPLGTMPQGEHVIIDGQSSQLGTDRWGDYQSLSVDPSDGRTFWFTGQYGTNSSWSTQIASFAFGSAPTGTITVTSTTPAILNDAGDVLSGSNGDDTILGASGNDTINGGAGNELISGGDGDDLILGGAGQDTLNGNGGSDTVDGQGGADLLSGGTGDDTIIWDGLNDGDDTITSDSGGDTLQVGGQSTDDTFSIDQSAAGELIISQSTSSIFIPGSGLEAGIESVVVNGGSGNDNITITDVDLVGTLFLSVNGGAGGDTITATGASLGNVRLAINGDLGDDTLTGSAGADTISGGDGNDVITGEAGNDTLSGNAGADSISGGDGNDVIDGNDGNDTALGDAGDDSLLGSFGDDMLTGGIGNDTINGGFGDDLLNGMSGNDSILGSFGNDRIAAGSGDDTVNGGNDNDTIQGHSGADLINGSHGDDLILGQAGNDTVFGDDGNDTIMAGNGNDVVYGEDGDDIIDGEGASDTVVGGDGNDTLRGGGSDDTITGDQGDDVINGNSGNDTASTGEGADTVSAVETIDESFILSTDLIQDFNILANL